MKKLIFTFSLFFLLINGFSQGLDMSYPVKNLEKVELIATYNLAYQQDSLNPYEIREEKMLLFLGKTQSNFLSNNNFLSIELFKSLSTEADLQAVFTTRELQPPISRFRYQIFKNFPQGKISTIDYVLPDFYKYQENIPLLNWSISNETKNLLGYQVQKATTSFGGRIWIVWFASEIPYSDGPYKFNGLPGLILKVHDTRNHYLFELVSIDKPEEIQTIEFPDRRYIEATKKDFFRAQEAFRHNITSRAAEAGLDNHTQQVAAENLRRRNNPIELTAD